MFDELTRSYGYYMVSCALARGSVNSSSRELSKPILDPKLPLGVSRDTSELFAMAERIKSTLVQTNDANGTFMAGACSDFWQCLLITRSVVFHCFREALDSDSKPALWLAFQLDCSEWDPFLQIFRVASLLNVDFLPLLRESAFPDKIDKEVDWACIDEAQEDFRERAEPYDFFSACIFAICTWQSDQDDFVYFRQVIFAGTSLNAPEAFKAREAIAEIVALHSKEYRGKTWAKDVCSMATKFPLIKTRDDAEAVPKSFGLDDADTAVDKGERLRGRVKWTAIYAEKIIEEIKRGETKNYNTMSNGEYQESIRETFAKKKGGLNFKTLADETFNEITDSLCARLVVLQEQGSCIALLDRLLEAAISADILGRPHVFYQTGDIQPVEQGFAIVDSWIAELESKLEGDFTFADRIESQVTASLKKDQPVEDGVVSLLAEVDKPEYALGDCQTEKITDEMLRDGFTIVDCTMVKLATDLEEEGLAIVDRSRAQLTAKPFKTTAMTNQQIEKLAERITRMKNGFTVEHYVKNKLTVKMVKQGFTVWGSGDRKQLRKLLKDRNITIDNETDHQLTARLKDSSHIDGC